MRKIITFVSAFFLLAIIFPSPLKAVEAGTCECKLKTITCSPVAENNNCNSGFTPTCSGSVLSKCGCTCTGKIVQSDIWCGGDTNKYKVINTAIGCIPINQNEFLSTIIGWAVGIGGGIAFLLIIYAGFMIMTASGSPERMQSGKELLTSAIAGLILLIFSVFILKFIGIDILGLSKFGFGG